MSAYVGFGEPPIMCRQGESMSGKIFIQFCLLIFLAAGLYVQTALAESPQMPVMHAHCPMMSGATGHEAMHARMMQQHVGASSMPFDLTHSLHIFTPLQDGGEQDVVSTNGDAIQIGLIQSHLKTEADHRVHGNYDTPAHIHGASMPGMADMASGASSIHVVYLPLPFGGRIIYSTSKPELVRAIHRWLKAQAQDHANDAMLSHQ